MLCIILLLIGLAKFYVPFFIWCRLSTINKRLTYLLTSYTLFRSTGFLAELLPYCRRGSLGEANIWDTGAPCSGEGGYFIDRMSYLSLE